MHCLTSEGLFKLRDAMLNRTIKFYSPTGVKENKKNTAEDTEEEDYNTKDKNQFNDIKKYFILTPVDTNDIIEHIPISTVYDCKPVEIPGITEEFCKQNLLISVENKVGRMSTEELIKLIEYKKSLMDIKESDSDLGSEPKLEISDLQAIQSNYKEHLLDFINETLTVNGSTEDLLNILQLNHNLEQSYDELKNNPSFNEERIIIALKTVQFLKNKDRIISFLESRKPKNQSL